MKIIMNAAQEGGSGYNT